MTPDQTFILAVLAVVVTPLINYLITAQANKALREQAKETAAEAKQAAIEARRTAMATELLRTEALAAYERADHFNAKIDKALTAVKQTNGEMVEAVMDAVYEPPKTDKGDKL